MTVPVVLSPRPFGRELDYVQAAAGRTVRSVVLEAVRAGRLALADLGRAVLYVDGAAVPRDRALDHVLAEGQVVNLVVEPMGGGGGGGKDVGRVLLQIAVIAVSAWVGGGAGGLLTGALTKQVAAAAVLTLGQMAVASLFAPDRDGQAAANDRYALSGQSNDFRPWAPFPLALGSVVVAPDMAVKTFTGAVGDDVWLYGILGLHYGPCVVEDLKIGDTLASSMGAGDWRMVQHLTPGPRDFTIYPHDTDQLDLQEELQATTGAATPVVRAAGGEGERFEFDFYLPAGLHLTKDDGRVVAVSLSVTVRYRPIDEDGQPTGAWTHGLTLSRTSTTREPMRITEALALPMGRYEFEFVRSLRPDANAKRRDDIALTAIRAVAFRQPVADQTLSIIEFAVRASALNQGRLAPITCRITPVCEVWDGDAWGDPQPTSNPAALARWLLTGPAPAKPLAAIQADARLRAWSEICDEYGWTAHVWLADDRRQDAALGLLEQAGRAGLSWDGSQLAASPWVEKPAPAQLFAGDNLRDHRWTVVYPEPVHALRVEFANLDRGGAADELYVYADGYGPQAGPGVQAAVLIEALRLDGQKTMERAYRDGRWELGRRMHQRRVDTWVCDMEYLTASYGSRVRLAWDRVAGGGQGGGDRAGGDGLRVRCRRWAGGLVSGLRLTAPVRMEAGRDYAVDIRLPGEVIANVPVVTTPGLVREITFAAPRAPDLSPAAGYRIAFGESERISEDVEIIGVEPGEGLTARLTAIRYVAPLLMEGETGPIPPLQSRLTLDRERDPPAPTLLGLAVEPDGVRVGFAIPPWRGSPLTGFSTRWRPRPEGGQQASWTSLPDLPATASVLTTPPMRELPLDGEDVTRVEVQIRAMTASGQVSPPLTVTASEPVVDSPAVGDWTVAVMAPAGDGSSQPALVVTGSVRARRAHRVEIAYATTADGPWIVAYDAAPTTEAVVVAGLVSLQDYWVSIRYFSRDGVPGLARVLGPYTAPGLIAGDVTHIGERPVAEWLEELARVDELGQELGRVRPDLDMLFGDSEALAQTLLRLARETADLRTWMDYLGREDGERVGAVVKTEVRERLEGDLAQAERTDVVAAGLSASIAAVETSVSGVATGLTAETSARTTQISQVNSRIALAETSVTTVASNLAVEVSARQLLAGRVDNVEGAIVTEAGLRLSGDQAEASLRQALALTVESNRVTAENGVSALVTALAGEVTAREALGLRVGAAEGAITNEATIRANQDTIYAGWFTRLGVAKGGATGWIANESSFEIGSRGPIGTVLNQLIATDGSASSAITALQTVTAEQATQLTNLSLTVGGQTTSITNLLSVTQGLGARWTVALNSNNQITGLVADSQSRSWIFSGAHFAIVDNGNGLSYSAATGRLQVVKGTRKVFMNAGDGPILWAGSTGVADGAETTLNGVLGVGDDGAWFGGTTPSGPFDAGPTGATPVSLAAGWVTLVSTTTKYMLPGLVSLRFVLRATLSPPQDDELPTALVSWRLVSTTPAGGDVQVIAGGQQLGAVNQSNIILGANDQLGLVNATGERVLRFQMGLFDDPQGATAATVHSVRMWGLYLQGASMAPF